MQPINIIGALFFGSLAVLTGGFGVFNLVDVQQTMFGPARVATAIPIVQLTMAVALIVIAILFARACANRCRRCAQDLKRDSG